MRRLRHHLASVVSLVVLTFVATNGLPRHASYVHRHAGDLHGHVHGHADDGARAARSTLSVRDFARHDHGHPHDHDHAHAHAREHRHDHPHAPPRAQDAVAHRAATERAGDDAQPHHVTTPARTATKVARAAAHGSAYALPGEPVHEHWQDPFQTAATAASSRVLAVALVVAPAGVAPVAAPVERARALRARGPPLSPA